MNLNVKKLAGIQIFRYCLQRSNYTLKNAGTVPVAFKGCGDEVKILVLKLQPYQTVDISFQNFGKINKSMQGKL